MVSNIRGARCWEVASLNHAGSSNYTTHAEDTKGLGFTVSGYGFRVDFFRVPGLAFRGFLIFSCRAWSFFPIGPEALNP